LVRQSYLLTMNTPLLSESSKVHPKNRPGVLKQSTLRGDLSMSTTEGMA
jgi:hypothetical protein